MANRSPTNNWAQNSHNNHGENKSYRSIWLLKKLVLPYMGIRTKNKSMLDFGKFGTVGKGNYPGLQKSMFCSEIPNRIGVISIRTKIFLIFQFFRNALDWNSNSKKTIEPNFQTTYITGIPVTRPFQWYKCFCKKILRLECRAPKSRSHLIFLSLAKSCFGQKIILWGRNRKKRLR